VDRQVRDLKEKQVVVHRELQVIKEPKDQKEPQDPLRIEDLKIISKV
jgi:hypothetical protein